MGIVAVQREFDGARLAIRRKSNAIICIMSRCPDLQSRKAGGASRQVTLKQLKEAVCEKHWASAPLACSGL